MCLLDTGSLQVVEDHGGEILLLAVAELGFGDVVDEIVILVNAEDAVRQEALHGKGSGDTDLASILVRLVVEVFVVGLGGNGGVDFLLAGDAVGPPRRVSPFDCLGQASSASRGTSHSS